MNPNPDIPRARGFERELTAKRSARRWLALILAPMLTLTACSIETPTPMLTATPSATATPAFTPTPSVTPTPDPARVHPLSIHRMRQQTYPGGELVVDQTLAPGGNYDRYLVRHPSEGLMINALFTLPRGEKPASGWPAVVFNHGYIPPAQYVTAARYKAYVDAFARQGYAVLMSDYRGHGSSEGEAEGGYGSPAYTVDVLNALSALRRHPDVDPERIGMWGHSMGGHITLRSMVVTDTVKAGVIWAGVVVSYPDLFTRWRGNRPTATPLPVGMPTPTSPWGRHWRQELLSSYGDPESQPAFWDAISPISFVDDLSAPIQLHHGTADSSVPYGFSETLRDDMEAAGKPVEFFGYEGADHNLSQVLNTALQRSVAFFDLHVKGSGEGGPDSD